MPVSSSERSFQSLNSHTPYHAWFFTVRIGTVNERLSQHCPRIIGRQLSLIPDTRLAAEVCRAGRVAGAGLVALQDGLVTGELRLVLRVGSVLFAFLITLPFTAGSDPSPG